MNFLQFEKLMEVLERIAVAEERGADATEEVVEMRAQETAQQQARTDLRDLIDIEQRRAAVAAWDARK